MDPLLLKAVGRPPLGVLGASGGLPKGRQPLKGPLARPLEDLLTGALLVGPWSLMPAAAASPPRSEAVMSW
jgi:hypothetical protein